MTENNGKSALINAREAAQILKVEISTIYDLVKKGTIPAQKLGTRMMVLQRIDIEAVAAEREKQLRQTAAKQDFNKTNSAKVVNRIIWLESKIAFLEKRLNHLEKELGVGT